MATSTALVGKVGGNVQHRGRKAPKPLSNLHEFYGSDVGTEPQPPKPAKMLK